VAQKEWDYWLSAEPPTVGPEEQRKLIARRITTAKRMLNAITARVTLVHGDEEVAPGVFFEPMFGHTAGHVMVAIAMGSQMAYNIGDVVVQPLFIEHPEWSPSIDMDAGMADAARRRFFARAAAEGALVFGYHLGPFPNLGRLVKRGDAWRWQPIETTG
jgi:glyoxylase-like metal-dependent hydrolase (beta-lactamase superfamily II)